MELANYILRVWEMGIKEKEEHKKQSEDVESLQHRRLHDGIPRNIRSSNWKEVDFLPLPVLKARIAAEIDQVHQKEGVDTYSIKCNLEKHFQEDALSQGKQRVVLKSK